MRARAWFLGLSVAGLLWIAAVVPARAQGVDIARFVGKTVASVRLEVNGQVETSPALLSLVDVKVLEPFTLEAYTSSLRRLANIGRFDRVDVALSASATGDGVDVVFLAKPTYPIGGIRFEGDTGLDQKELERRLKERYGGVPTRIPSETVNYVVIDLLHEEGYRQADSGVTVEPTPKGDRATLVFHVTAGALAQIGHVTVNNKSPLPDDRLKQDTGAMEGRLYRPRAIRAALDRIVAELKNKGYYAAAAVSQPLEASDRRIDLTLIVDAGTHVVLRWAPDGDAPPPGNIGDYVPIAREQTADDDLLDDSDKQIEAVLKNAGFADAVVRHTRDKSPGDEVITYRVTRGPQHRVDRVEMPPNLQLTSAEISALVGLRPRDVFEQARVNGGLQRVHLEYLARGYYKVAVSAETEKLEKPGEAGVWVVLRLKIVEGPPGMVGDIQFVRDTALVPEVELRAAMRSVKGRPYVSAVAQMDRIALETVYLNRGFRSVVVDVKPVPGADDRTIALAVQIREGLQVIVADIQVFGNHHLEEKSIREDITLQEGQPYAESQRIESQQRLRLRGVFSSVTVGEEERRDPADARAHVIARVVESPDTTISFGGGLEAGRRARSAVGGGIEDHLEIAPRGFFGIGRRNLGGRDRSVDLFTRISLRPNSVPGDPARDGRGLGVGEYRATLTYRESRAFRTDTTLLVGVTSEQAVRTTFNFIRQAANAAFLRHVTQRVSFSGRYSLDHTRLFDERVLESERPLIDRLFPQVRLSILSSGVIWDRRNDSLAPSSGTFMSADAEFAIRHIGSEVGYVKTFIQVYGFHPLPALHGSVLAVRAQGGVARGFERTVPVIDASGRPTVSSRGEPQTKVVADLPASQRFFAGGSTTVRGFQLDRLGVPGILNKDGLSNGGNGLVVLNAELRTAITHLFGRTLAAVGFVDAGNVFERAGDIDLLNLRGAAGFGFRYDSPVGPVRLDFGFKLSRLMIGGVRERGWEYHLSFGEAF
jgi:outer membrane protein assembly complex protein YaeT